MDSRFPNIIRLGDAPKLNRDQRVRKRVMRWVREICNRTMTHAAYNTVLDAVYFYRGSVDRGVWSLPLFTSSGSLIDHDHEGGIDHAVSMMQSALMPKERKDRILANAQDEDRKDAERADRERLEDIRPEAIEKLEYMQSVRGMRRGYRKSAVVNP